jgi:matrix metalloproteinase-14 (membrane-inserted)
LSKGWGKQDLKFKIANYPTNTRLSNKEMDLAIEKAFNMWQKVSGLRFTREKTGPVDINLSFEKAKHGNGEYFKIGELGHAFLPKDGGDIHFAGSEKWTIDEYNGKNLLGIALH